jgi:hypothetical protein
MDENEQTPEQRATSIAAIACFVSLLFTYLAVRHLIAAVEFGWSELVILLFFPVAVTFAVLYRSHWHREITGISRTFSLLGLSCIIAVGEAIGVGLIYCMGLFCLNGMSGGNH